MTTPTPTPQQRCPGCGKLHAPHPELGVWCTAACIGASQGERGPMPKARKERARKKASR